MTFWSPTYKIQAGVFKATKTAHLAAGSGCSSEILGASHKLGGETTG